MRGLRLVTLAAIPVLVLSACSSSAATTAPQQQSSGNVKWFVGLGSGSKPENVQPQKDWVANYNKTNKDGIHITLEIVPNANAFDTLKTEIAAGNTPDIIGPIGVKGRAIFKGLLLDLTSEISKQKFDLTQYDAGVISAIKSELPGQMVALPYSIYAGYVWYNKDIFSAAGLPNLPTKVGDQYQGKDWSFQTMGDLAASLTKDSAGNISTDPAFDAKNIVQYGLGFQWFDDFKRVADSFGSGSLVAADGKTAQIPAAWASGLQWYYDAIQVKHIIPDNTAANSPLMGGGNLQSSGNLAMNMAWAWSISSIATVTSGPNVKVKTWDIGVWPSWNGTVSAPADIDGFALAASTKSPDQAFKAMEAIVAAPELSTTYGASPAKLADQAAYYSNLDTSLAVTFPTNGKITWSVLGEDYKHVPAVSHEAWMPDYNAANNDANALIGKLRSTAGLDLTKELATLQTTLQADFTNNLAQ
jgi:multiple sugar transport system substrate-binding protein